MTNTNALIKTHVEITEDNLKLIELIKLHNFILCDDHHDGATSIADGIAIYTNESTKTQHVVPLHKHSAQYPYYSINHIEEGADGKPHLTRNAVSSMFKTSSSLSYDINAWRNGFNWELIEAKPFMHPGHLTNLIERE